MQGERRGPWVEGNTELRHTLTTSAHPRPDFTPRINCDSSVTEMSSPPSSPFCIIVAFRIRLSRPLSSALVCFFLRMPWPLRLDLGSMVFGE